MDGVVKTYTTAGALNLAIVAEQVRSRVHMALHGLRDASWLRRAAGTCVSLCDLSLYLRPGTYCPGHSQIEDYTAPYGTGSNL